MHRPWTGILGSLVLSVWAASGAAAGEVDIELRPASQFVFVGAVASLDLFAVSADGFDQEFGLIGVVIQWDAAALALSGNVDSGPFAWAASGFPADSAGLNDDLTDGDAYYQATVQETGAQATATASGLRVTTLEFTALAGATGVTAVTIQPCNGSTCTLVLDRHPFDPAATEITGLLGAPVAVTIECNADPDCDDANPCTDDTCEPDDTCANTPNDGNDPDDGLFCNGNEIACDNGEIIIEAGSIPDCDDGLTCTDDACNESTMECDNTIAAGSCLIEGV